MNQMPFRSFDWEYEKANLDAIPFPRDRYKNRCCKISSMQHALIAAFEAKVNINIKRTQIEGYRFSVHSLIYNCARLLSGYGGLDPHRELHYSYGIKALYEYGVYTTFNNEKMACPIRFKALEILYFAGDEDLVGERAWDKTMFCIHSFGPVAAMIKCFDDYENFNHTGGAYKAIGKPDEEAQFHYVLLVGYNSELKVFSYLNSRGPEFGTNGRAYVEFNSVVEVYAPLLEGDVPRFPDSQLILGNDPLPRPPSPLIRN